MKRIYQLLTLTLLLSQFSHAQTSIELFNGNNLDGWYAYEAETGIQSQASDLFSVENNMIRFSGKKTGYLMSEKSYSNYELTVEFRWNMDTTVSRKHDNPNSGIMYLIPTNAPDKQWPKGIQFQVKKGGTGDFILLDEVTLQVKGQKVGPGKSVVSPRFKDASHALGEWNTATIIVKDNTVKQLLNGELVNEGSNPSVSKGRILLQYEGFPIDFRKVELKPIHYSLKSVTMN